MRLTVLAGVILANMVTLSGRGIAQQQRAASPLEVARAAFAASDSGRWKTLLGLVHPLALRAFREQQFSMVTGSGRGGAADESFARQEERMMHFFLERVYFVANIGEFKKLPLDTLLVRYLEYNRNAWASKPDSLKVEVSRRLVGQVLDGDSVAYVLIAAPAVDSPHHIGDLVEFITLRRSQGRWRTMLNGGLVFGVDDSYSFSFSDSDEAELNDTVSRR